MSDHTSLFYFNIFIYHNARFPRFPNIAYSNLFDRTENSRFNFSKNCLKKGDKRYQRDSQTHKSKIN